MKKTLLTTAVLVSALALEAQDQSRVVPWLPGVTGLMHWVTYTSNQLYTTRLVTTTNTHWVTISTDVSDRNCLVLGCKADHSEKRTELQSGRTLAINPCLRRTA
jgi:hypothetical protein